METPIWVLRYRDDRKLATYAETEDMKGWKNQAKTWWEKFLPTIGATGFSFRSMYCEFSAFFKVGERWWYINSGDVRYKISKSLLIRQARNEHDLTGLQNQSVPYDKNFIPNLKAILKI